MRLNNIIYVNVYEVVKLFRICILRKNVRKANTSDRCYWNLAHWSQYIYTVFDCILKNVLVQNTCKQLCIQSIHLHSDVKWCKDKFIQKLSIISSTSL